MSEFKFACPVCGQHITCDSGSSGSKMACPTCFRQLVVPQATAPGGSSLVLSASEVQTRFVPPPGNGADEAGRAGQNRGFPWAALGLGLVVCTVAAAAFVYRGKIVQAYQQAMGLRTSSPPAATKPAVAAERATSWTLNLTKAKIPDAPAAGLINGQHLTLPRATIHGDLLILWPGAAWPPDEGVAVSLSLFAKKAENLAGKTIVIEAARTNAPRMLVRWKDGQGQSVTQDFHAGYALRLEFGDLAGNRLPGKIYLAAPDDGRSYVAGTFDLEIHQASPKPKPKP